MGSRHKYSTNMGRKPRLLAAGSLALAMILAGCLGDKVAGTTGVGNPPQSEVTFAMVATQAAPAASGYSANPIRKTGERAVSGAGNREDTAFTVTDQGGSRFTLREAIAHVGRVRFRLPEGMKCSPAIAQACEIEDIRVDGPFIANLMDGTFTPVFPSFKAPVGTYRRVELRLEALEPGTPSPEPALHGHSMILSGTFAYGERADRAFTIALDFDEEARFDSGYMRVEEKSLNQLLLLFDVDDWLSQADITGCLEDGSLRLDGRGDLRIDKDNACAGLEKAIKDGIKASGEMAARK